LKDICDKLDNILLAALPNDGIRFFGLSQPVKKGDQVHPVTIEDNEQVSIDQKYDAIVFHRLNGDATWAEVEEEAFGRDTGRVRVQPMRTFIAHKFEKGEEWIDYFLNNFPNGLSIDVNGVDTYDFIDLVNGTLKTNQEAIYNEEFGENSYEKHTIPWNIYALDYDIQFIRC